MQITASCVADNDRIGRIPSIDNHLQIKDVSADPHGVSFQWAGAAANHFLVQWVARLGDDWQTIATLPSAGRPNMFIDTDPNRLTNMVGFYRVQSE